MNYIDDFTIVDSTGKTYTVSPMTTIPNAYYLSDDKGHRCEIGINAKSGEWVRTPYELLALTPFEFDLLEIGHLIENH